ncbi:MAG: integrase, partial [Spirochaetaceae bacterium]|nr:integrase [Spirochaetaceae bacterium]
MEVVYLFCESDIVRIPFFDYDKPLFRLLAGKGGVWDKTRHQFVFRQDIISKQLDQIYSDIPCVWVE